MINTKKYQKNNIITNIRKNVKYWKIQKNMVNKLIPEMFSYWILII
jgi:hypothetical protein